ncbi:MAG: hypothetical protein P8Y37_00320 [Anaerolineales bacterium]
MAELLCPNCGRHNSKDREFCDFCGDPLDGALQVEEPSVPGASESPEDQDEISRLDSFFSDAESENLETESPSQESSEAGSRLDSYLSEQEPPSQLDAGDTSSRLDDYLSPQDNEDPFEESFQSSVPENQETYSRLDEYLGEDNLTSPPPSSQAQETEDESSRLDDFFSDEIFDSPDPFQELPRSEPSGNPLPENSLEDFSQPAEELSLPEELEDKLNGTEAEFEQEDPWMFPAEETDPAGGELSEDWDFLKEEPSPEEVQSEEPPATQEDDSDWDFPDFESAGEGTAEKEAPVAETSPGEWDFLDPALTADQPLGTESQSAERASDNDETRLDSLDANTEVQSSEQLPQSSPDENDLEEWNFLDPGLEDEGKIQEESPREEQASDEFDWLDLPPDKGEIPLDSLDSDEGKTQSGEQLPQSSSQEDGGEDWNFLDPSLANEDELQDTVPADEGAPDEFDWLDPASSSTPEEYESQPEFDSEGFGEDSGWLDMLQSPESREAPEPESIEPEKPQTDWLDKIKRLNQSSDLVDEDSSFPDWLAVSEQPSAAEDKADADEPHSDESEVPDWLKVEDEKSLNEFLRKKDLTNEEYQPQITEHPGGKQSPQEKEDAPAAGLSDSQQIKFPSWAGDETEKTKKSTGKQSGSVPANEATEPFQIGEEYIDDLFNEELPDWLTSASSVEIAPSPMDDLAQGELPGWVEAMRPVIESADSSGLSEDEEYIENYGPLAGIPSVLPAEAEIGINLNETGKKPLDLLTTKSHQDYVNLLKKIISNENKAKTIQRPAPPQTQRMLRWLIAIVLLVATAGTVIFSDIIEPQPPSPAQIQGTGYAALYDQIEKLSDGQPVLIAYDYQPAAAGELEIAAATVVDHLMEQGTYLSFVSTQPTGPALAEEFLSSTQAEHGYLHNQKYVNLGYLPGESAGLLSFLIAPKQIIPLAFNGSNAWDSPPLRGVNSIADFRMIMVITDDPNTAKTWIEQVKTRLGGTPLTMVVSAQVEPLIQPYFRSSPRMLDGYVAGVIDSMNYEQLSARPNLASKIWLPFNTGIIISVGIIFIGGLANGVLSLFSQRRTKLVGENQ